MKVMDERMASAVGPRGHRHNVARKQSPETSEEVQVQMMEPISSGGETFGGEEVNRWRIQMPSLSSPFLGPLSCSVVVFLIALSVFGLEIYRIREVNDLAQRTETLEKDLEVLRSRTSHFDTFKLSNEDEIHVVRLKDEEFGTGKKHDGYHQIPEEIHHSHLLKRSLNSKHKFTIEKKRSKTNNNNLRKETEAAEFIGTVTGSSDNAFWKWRPIKWMTKMENVLLLNEGQITIQKGGLYFIYIQVNISSEAATKASFNILRNGNVNIPLLQCSYYGTPEAQRQTTCFTARTYILQQRDIIELQKIPTHLMLLSTEVVLGFIRLNEISENDL